MHLLALFLFALLSVSTSNAAPVGRQVFSPENPLRIAFAYVGPVDDIGWTFSHNEGRVSIEDYFGATVSTVAFENVSEDPEVGLAFFRQLAEEGYHFIIGTSFEFQDPMYQVSQEYPNIRFLHISGYLLGPNFSNAFGRMYQSRFLSGIAAGMMTQNNRVGFVAAFQIPEVYRGVNSFNIGMKLANPDATLHVLWTNTWVDPDLESYASSFLLDQVGVDVITQDQDTFTPQLEANKRGRFSVGYNTDMGRYVSTSVLTSAVWNWGPMYIRFTQQVLDGTWQSESYWGPFTDGLSDVGKFSVLLDPSAVSLIMNQRAQLIAGTKDVFCGEDVVEFDPQGPNGCMLDSQLLSMNKTRSDIVDEGFISIPLVRIDLPDGVTITMQVLAALVIVLVFVLIVLLLVYRMNTVIRYASPVFCIATCIGSIIMLVTVFLLSPTPTGALCTIAAWTICIGFTLFYGNLLAKTLRVYIIFRSVKNFERVKVTNMQLFPFVGVLLALDVILLVLFTAIDTPTTSHDTQGLDPYEYRSVCDYNGAAFILIWIMVGYKGIQLFVGIILAFLTRSVSKAFNESQSIAGAIYSFAFVFVVIVPVVALLDDTVAIYVLISLGLIFVNLAALLIMFVPKFYLVFTGQTASVSMTTAASGTAVGMRSLSSEETPRKP